jgi:hypothetical protein
LSIFHQIEFLPIAYFIILMWVVCAGIIGKLLGPMLIEVTSGTLHRLLERRINVHMTADEIVLYLFEQQLLANVYKRILLNLVVNLVRLFTERLVIPLYRDAFNLRATFFPEKYWSGCPPNAA